MTILPPMQHEFEGEAYSGTRRVGRVRLAYADCPHGGIISWAGQIHFVDDSGNGTDVGDVDTVRLDGGAIAQIVVTSGGGSGSPFYGNGPPPHQAETELTG